GPDKVFCRGAHVLTYTRKSRSSAHRNRASCGWVEAGTRQSDNGTDRRTNRDARGQSSGNGGSSDREGTREVRGVNVSRVRASDGAGANRQLTSQRRSSLASEASSSRGAD